MLDTETSMVSVQRSDGELLLPYDQCVLALGSEPSFEGVTGASEHALPFYTLDDALQVHDMPPHLTRTHHAHQPHQHHHALINPNLP